MRLPWCLALLCLAVLAVVGVPAPEGFVAEGRTAPLVRLAPSPLPIRTPDGVTGKFTVAKTAPEIDFAVLPGQWEGGKLWSSWGDSALGADGCFYASIGDHDGPFGNAYVYRIDPVKREARLIVDYNKVVGIPKGTYAPGKIHAPICDGGDGWVYFAGYRGSAKTANEAMKYVGDWLLRYEMATGKAENLGVLVPHMSVATLRVDQARGMLYGLAIPGDTRAKADNGFFAYSLKSGSVAFFGGPPSPTCRTIMRANDGRVYYDAEGGRLYRYDPADNTLVATKAVLPQRSSLRAASEAGPDGRVYGFTMKGEIFAFDPAKERIVSLGQAFPVGRLYITTCRLSPGGRYLYFMPGAHGGTRPTGSPIVQLDVKTGVRKVLCFLYDYLAAEAKFESGGSFAMALNADGSALHLNLNGNAPGAKAKDFGVDAVLTIAIPASEREGDKL